MKRVTLILALLLSLSSAVDAPAWGGFGHRVVVMLAQRNLTANAKKNISKYFSYELYKDASWMDTYRDDPRFAYTGKYHTMAMDAQYRYEPALRIKNGGDCITGLEFVDYNLRNMEELHLSDSAIVFNVRILIHILGDMHCVCHSYPDAKSNGWDVVFNGTDYTYHSLFDKSPQLINSGLSESTVAKNLDNWSEGAKAECAKGSFEDWAQDACTRDSIIYEINPRNASKLDPNTLKLATPAINEALRKAGYRLAYLLNSYFDY